MKRRFVFVVFILIAAIISTTFTASRLLALDVGDDGASTGAGTSVFLPVVMQADAMRVAILGDSGQDEYRADDNRGGLYAATTFNWVEMLARFRSVQVGAWGTRDEPRRTGYEFSWARSGGISYDVLTEQVPGVISQLQSGQVTHALIQVGSNDFLQIWSGLCDGTTGNGALDDIAANISEAARDLNAVAPGRVLLAALQDFITPQVVIKSEEDAFCPSPAGQQRFVEAIAYINARLDAQAAADGVRYWDYNAALQAELDSRRSRQNFLNVGGELIDMNTRGNEPHHGLLADQYLHPGTVVSGLVANLWIDALNEQLDAGLAPFTDAEILNAAGIHSSMAFPATSMIDDFTTSDVGPPAKYWP